MEDKDNLIVIPDPVDIPQEGLKKENTISRKAARIGIPAAVAAGIFGDQIITSIIDDTIPVSETAGIDELTVEIQPEDVTTSEVDTTDINLMQWDPASATKVSENTVSDSMSFEEAFAAARQETGAGGIFVWHGEAYNTFYEEEAKNIDFMYSGDEAASATYANNDDTYDTAGSADYITTEVTEETEEASIVPAIIAADLNADGDADAVFADLNLDGSADLMSTDLNNDGILAEDEVIVIHDPATLIVPETLSDGTTMSVDINADSMDDILVADMNNDQVADLIGSDENRDQQIDQSEIQVLNPDAISGMSSSATEYSGEVATDLPEDVSPETLDQMDDDLSNLEDDFSELNEWA